MSNPTNLKTFAIPRGAVLSSDLILSAEPLANLTATGIKIDRLRANETQTFGDVCYLNSSGKAQLIDADAIANMSGVLMLVDARIGASQYATYLVLGIARRDAWTWTVGGLIYGSLTGTTTNTLTQTAPSAVDDVIQILGVATHADRMLFMPQLVQVEHT